PPRACRGWPWRRRPPLRESAQRARPAPRCRNRRTTAWPGIRGSSCGVRAGEDRIARPGPGGQQAARGRLFSPMRRQRAKPALRGRRGGARRPPILRGRPRPRPPLPAFHAAAPVQPLSPARELYLFALFRILVASLLALVVFSPAGSLIGNMHLPQLARTV